MKDEKEWDINLTTNPHDSPRSEWVYDMMIKSPLLSYEDTCEKKECKDCDYFVTIENAKSKVYSCAYYAIVDVENIPPLIKNAPKGCPLNMEEFLEGFFEGPIKF